MFLRTGCDRELYLSLHKDAVLANEGLPVPLRARPGIGVLKQAGNDFEDAKNAEIVAAFPGLVFGDGNGGVNAQPQHYCAPNAELIDHLSRIVGITKGARKTFGLHAITTSAAVAQTTGAERPYREHSLLRKERSRIQACLGPGEAALLWRGAERDVSKGGRRWCRGAAKPTKSRP